MISARNPLTTLATLLLAGLVACGGSSKGPPAGGSGGAGGAVGGAGGAVGGAGGVGPVGGALGDAGADVEGPVAGAGGSAGAAGTAGTGGTAAAPAYCELGTTQCNDGVDNDGDNLADALDPECVSPCDNDEGSFATGISGDNIDACKQDCFFDGNSGQGDDGCEWNLKCDSNNPGGSGTDKVCPYDPTFTNCPDKQSQKCTRNCQKLTPNGCDCFGCCAVESGGQTVNVLLAGSCTADKFGDPMACPRCTQNQDCVNPCDACEVCLGRPAPPASCSGTPDGGTSGADGGNTPPPPMCPSGTQSCGPGGQVPADGCGAGYFCQTGCCVRFVIE